MLNYQTQCTQDTSSSTQQPTAERPTPENNACQSLLWTPLLFKVVQFEATMVKYATSSKDKVDGKKPKVGTISKIKF